MTCRGSSAAATKEVGGLGRVLDPEHLVGRAHVVLYGGLLEKEELAYLVVTQALIQVT